MGRGGHGWMESGVARSISIAEHHARKMTGDMKLRTRRVGSAARREGGRDKRHRHVCARTLTRARLVHFSHCLLFSKLERARTRACVRPRFRLTRAPASSLPRARCVASDTDVGYGHAPREITDGGSVQRRQVRGAPVPAAALEASGDRSRHSKK